MQAVAQVDTYIDGFRILSEMSQEERTVFLNLEKLRVNLLGQRDFIYSMIDRKTYLSFLEEKTYNEVYEAVMEKRR